MKAVYILVERYETDVSVLMVSPSLVTINDHREVILRDQYEAHFDGINTPTIKTMESSLDDIGYELLVFRKEIA